MTKNKKVAVITGAAQRIGAAIARELHGAGFDIALHYRSSQNAAQVLADELCRQREGSCQVFQADLHSVEEVRALAGQLLADYPAIDLLVNNASGFESTPIERCTEAEFDAMLGANLKGPYFLIQGLLPSLNKGGGSIVNIIDVHATQPLRNFNAYCAAKAGLASLTRSLAVELAPEIRVNGVSPGAILWPQGDADYDDAARDATIEQTPLKRLGEPTDIAKAVRYLACDAPFVTGQVIAVDGGRTLES
jgi:pteridine reductase